MYIYSINVIYIKSYISNIFLPCIFASVTWSLVFDAGVRRLFLPKCFFSSESNWSTFYFKEISIKSPFSSSFPSKNYKEMSLIFCLSNTVLETWLRLRSLCFSQFLPFYSSSFLPSSLLLPLARLSSVPSGLSNFSERWTVSCWSRP